MRAAIEQRRPGLLTYGITAPKRAYEEDKRRDVAARQTARINSLPVDGLVIYDLQDESSRTDAERPFPFMECIDPVDYAYDYLCDVAVPKVVYRCVAPLDEPTLVEGLTRIDDEDGLCVLVGAPSRRQSTRLSLREAHTLRRRVRPDLPVGGVLIAEREDGSASEHERVLRKVADGCSFMVTQAVYSVMQTKNVLSDLHYRCQELGQPVPPVLVTLSPCGSVQTLDFLRWLGVDIPRWLENELVHAVDILDTSVALCEDVFADLHAFAADHAIPLGCNVESVSLRKAEIDASVELVHRVAAIMDPGRLSPSGTRGRPAGARRRPTAAG